MACALRRHGVTDSDLMQPGLFDIQNRQQRRWADADSVETN
ncbi:MAG: hypothetical protein P8X74_12605 [Reinekea sp.]|jgi:hypothetical protein